MIIENKVFDSAKDVVIEMFLLNKGDSLVCYPPDSYLSLYARHCQNSLPVREIEVLKNSSACRTTLVCRQNLEESTIENNDQRRKKISARNIETI